MREMSPTGEEGRDGEIITGPGNRYILSTHSIGIRTSWEVFGILLESASAMKGHMGNPVFILSTPTRHPVVTFIQ